MKAKPAVAFLFLILIWVCAVSIECDLAMHFQIPFSVASVLGLVALLGGLSRAPEGYEDENGFHVGSPVRVKLR